MQGNLENTGLAELLLRLHIQKRSGILRLTRNEIRKSIYLVAGSIVFAHSNQKYDRLGETLLRLGKITLEEFEIASREVIEKGKRLGQALSDLGFISAQEVTAGVHYQLQQITYSLFDWEKGEFEFFERERPVFEDIMIDVSTPSLIIEGIRNITNPDVLIRAYEGDEQRVLQLNHGVPRLARTDLDFGEETLLACVDGARTIQAVRSLSHLTQMQFDRALYSLLVCGMLQFHDDRASAAAVEKFPIESHKSVPSFTTQPLVKSGKEKDVSAIRTLSEEELRRLIGATYQRYQNATDEEVLNVLPDCTLEEIDKAYEDLTGKFHPPYYSQSRFLDLKDPLKLILDRLSSAHDHLMERHHIQRPLEDTPLHPLQKNNPPSAPAPKVVAEKVAPAPAEKWTSEHDLPKETISELQDRLRKDPANTNVLRRLGKRLHESGKPHEGEKHLLKALELEPQNIENHFALADFYGSMGLKIKAFKHLNIILQLQPNNPRAMELLNLKPGKKALYEIEH